VSPNPERLKRSPGSEAPLARADGPAERGREMDDIASMDYETAAAELERTVELLGKEQEDLAESVRIFERGLQLARRCARLLDDAERRLNELAPAVERTAGP
jgi:exodeoxyribonuclease VII small subunit